MNDDKKDLLEGLQELREGQQKAREDYEIMNERIKELTFKAGAILYIEPPTGAVTGVTMSFESVEKFAELIVRECIDKIGENFVGAVGTHASAHNSAVLKCQTIIKEHFGIEDVD